MLPNLVPNATILYDYDYQEGSDDWKKAKKDEAKNQPHDRFLKVPHESGGSSWLDIMMNPV